MTELRAAVRSAARTRGIRVRTGLLDDDALAVVLSDADIWPEPAATMRAKLRTD